MSWLARNPLAFLFVLWIELEAGAGHAAAQVKDHLPPDVERLDKYLERLGTGNLRIRNLERASWSGRTRSPAYRRSPPGLPRSTRSDYRRSPSPVSCVTSPRLNRLIAARPGASSPRVRLTLLEGDYNRAEPLALKWVGNPAEKAARATH